MVRARSSYVLRRERDEAQSPTMEHVTEHRKARHERAQRRRPAQLRTEVDELGFDYAL
jgi:hypothetical protein